MQQSADFIWQSLAIQADALENYNQQIALLTSQLGASNQNHSQLSSELAGICFTMNHMIAQLTHLDDWLSRQTPATPTTISTQSGPDELFQDSEEQQALPMMMTVASGPDISVPIVLSAAAMPAPFTPPHII